MKENIVMVRKVDGYIAVDGMWFPTKEECKSYESSAKMVLFTRLKSKIVGKSTADNLFLEGLEENDVYIFKIDSMETLELFNRFIVVCSGDEDEKELLGEEMVGKEIIATWDYYHEVFCVHGTIEDVISTISKRYEDVVSEKRDSFEQSGHIDNTDTE